MVRVFTPEYREKLRRAKLGRALTETHRHNISNALKAVGHAPPTAWGRIPSETTRAKLRAAQQANKEAHRLRLLGANNPNWKGGNSKKSLRYLPEYREWRRAVLQRDDYKCVWCRATQNLQADHIKSFAEYPESRYDVSNGRTLCKSCHKTTLNYLYRGSRAHKQIYTEVGILMGAMVKTLLGSYPKPREIPKFNLRCIALVDAMRDGGINQEAIEDVLAGFQPEIKQAVNEGRY